MGRALPGNRTRKTGTTAKTIIDEVRPSRSEADEARQKLEEMIVTLELKPGTVWSETELSERLKIGRTPVREALKRLEAEYLVEIVPRSGAKVTDIDVMQQL